MNEDQYENDGRAGNDDPARPRTDRPVWHSQLNTDHGRFLSDCFRRRGIAAARLGITDEWRWRGREFCPGPSTFGLSPDEWRAEWWRLARRGWTRAEVADVLSTWDAA